MNISSKSSYMDSMPSQTNRQGTNNNRLISWRILSFFIFISLSIFLSSCEDQESIFLTEETTPNFRTTSGIVMEDVVMRISTPSETITRVEIHKNQTILEIFEGCGESDCELFVGNFPGGVYLVKVYSFEDEILAKEIKLV